MKRRKFIIGALAVLAVPMLPNIQTMHNKYVAWFKKEYGVDPYYTGSGELAGQLPPYVDRLVAIRRVYQNPTPVYHKVYDGKMSLYRQEEWDERRKEELEDLKILTFEEYKTAYGTSI